MIYFSNHCVNRYRERVKPGMDFDQAKQELIALVGRAEPQEDPPEWSTCYAADGNGYIDVTDGIAIACSRDARGRWIATTCLIWAGNVARIKKPKRPDFKTVGDKRRERNRVRRAA